MHSNDDRIGLQNKTKHRQNVLQMFLGVILHMHSTIFKQCAIVLERFEIVHKLLYNVFRKNQECFTVVTYENAS